MPLRRNLTLVLLLAASAPLGLSVAALAQDGAAPDSGGPPSRVGNRWDNRRHQPTPQEVPSGPPGQQQQEVDELEQLNRQLQSQVPRTGANPSP